MLFLAFLHQSRHSLRTSARKTPPHRVLFLSSLPISCFILLLSGLQGFPTESNALGYLLGPHDSVVQFNIGTELEFMQTLQLRTPDP